MSYSIWPARPEDLPVVMQLLYDRVRWLRSRGSDQWSTYRRWEPEMHESIARGETMLLTDRAESLPVGTITVTTSGDPEFWTPHERQTPALYLAKLATEPRLAGLNLGRLLLDYALYQAAVDHFQEVRMDVWKTSVDLHTYYQRQGWTLLRTVDVPGRFSGTLFSRVVSDISPQLPTGLSIEPP